MASAAQPNLLDLQNLPNPQSVQGEPPAMSLAQLAFQARLLALNAAVAAARGPTGGPLAAPLEQDLRRLAAQLGATATRLSALAASPQTDTDPADRR